MFMYRKSRVITNYPPSHKFYALHLNGSIIKAFPFLHDVKFLIK